MGSSHKRVMMVRTGLIGLELLVGKCSHRDHRNDSKISANSHGGLMLKFLGRGSTYFGI